MGPWVFSTCKKMLTLTCKATTPPSLDSNVFLQIKVSNGTLYVPKESIEIYKSTDQWKDWGAILEIDEETSINSIVTSCNKSYPYKVIKDGNVVIERNGASYNINGIKR